VNTNCSFAPTCGGELSDNLTMCLPYKVKCWHTKRNSALTSEHVGPNSNHTGESEGACATRNGVISEHHASIQFQVQNLGSPEITSTGQVHICRVLAQQAHNQSYVALPNAPVVSTFLGSLLAPQPVLAVCLVQKARFSSVSMYVYPWLSNTCIHSV
jgi:hypothetical protein